MFLRKTVVKVVKDYLKTLPVKVEEAIIFGSSARDERLWDSDIDLIVISSDFEKMSPHERSVLLLKHWKHKRVPLEAWGYVMEEYKKRVQTSLYFQDIDEHGIKIGALDDSKRLRVKI